MKKPLYIKIFGLFVLLLASMTVLMLIFSFGIIKRHYYSFQTDFLINTAKSTIPSVRPYLVSSKFKDLDGFIKKLGDDTGNRITVIGIDGKVYADSEEDPGKMENHLYRPEIQKALKRETGVSERYSKTLKRNMLYVAKPVYKGTKLIAVLRLSVYSKEMNALISELKNSIVKVSLIIIAISLIFAYFLSISFLKPVSKLSYLAKKVANGDFNEKIYLDTDDEINELADSFNYMTDKINELFNKLSMQKEELSSVISSMKGAVLVVGKDDRIILANDALNNISDNKDAIGRFYWEAIREPKYTSMFQEVKSSKQSNTREIVLKDKTYLCSISAVRSKEEYVVVFHDISEIKEVERLKKDFIANVSHELKTPLTAIKGFVETIEGNLKGENKEYMDIIARHTQRLINIVDDLLIISNLENTPNEIKFEEVNIEEVISNVVLIFDKKAKQKGLKLKFNSKNKVPIFKADSFKLEQLFINLIDNALKYTEKGGIDIVLSSNKNNVELLVKDTGIGISARDIPRIFDRFYVVDKSRSRKVGGTGLGLSIVKHIVILHSGSITVKSIPRKGTSFHIALPIKKY